MDGSLTIYGGRGEHNIFLTELIEENPFYFSFFGVNECTLIPANDNGCIYALDPAVNSTTTILLR